MKQKKKPEITSKETGQIKNEVKTATAQPAEKSARKPYLDNLRWAIVLIVLIYHVCFMFNGVGVAGGIPDARNVPALDAFQYIVYPWFMVLLFVVSGMSARYSLQKRTGRQFIRERALKLLVPSTLGLFVIHWITGYLNIKMGGGLDYIPGALVYPISAISGIGPLWFIQMLFLFSCLLLLLKTLDKKDRVWKLGGRIPIAAVLLLFFVMWGAAQILNMPVLTMYRFGIYLAAFLIGYYIFSHDEVQDAIEKIRIPMIVIAAAGAIAYTAYYYGQSFSDAKCLQSLAANLYLWAAVLALLGCARKYFNFENPLTKYMSKSSFSIYILHYPVLTLVCYALTYHLSLAAGWNYLIALAAELAASFVLYEIIRRVPVLRFLILGMKKKS
ncbi:MAG: acyltransferase [Clostridiales bacterium]|nr:acyltransferase [Clostridiales bacterium]